MSDLRKPLRIGSIVWSMLLGAGVIALRVGVILPSTKRARIDLHELHSADAENPASADASSPPATQP